MKRKLRLLALCSVLGLSMAVSQTTSADPQVCDPMCITGECSRNSDCTAQPNGRCNPVCPRVGCCVYG